jgi:hypothetical protein
MVFAFFYRQKRERAIDFWRPQSHSSRRALFPPPRAKIIPIMNLSEKFTPLPRQTFLPVGGHHPIQAVVKEARIGAIIQ